MSSVNINGVEYAAETIGYAIRGKFRQIGIYIGGKMVLSVRLDATADVVFLEGELLSEAYNRAKEIDPESRLRWMNSLEARHVAKALRDLGDDSLMRILGKYQATSDDLQRRLPMKNLEYVKAYLLK